MDTFHKELSEILGTPDESSIAKDEKIHFIYFYLKSLQHYFNYKQITQEDQSKFIDILQNISIELTISTKLPISKGVGSSASYLVTVAACLLV